MYKIQEINFPTDSKVIHQNFYNYDPAHSFSKANNLKYLNEDLLQCSFPKDALVIDLGWYGDVIANQGEFRIHIIKGQNWEIPLNIIYSKTAEETKNILNKILEYYSRTEVDIESI